MKAPREARLSQEYITYMKNVLNISTLSNAILVSSNNSFDITNISKTEKLEKKIENRES